MYSQPDSHQPEPHEDDLVLRPIVKYIAIGLGVAATVFRSLADAGIQTGMIATSEIRITTTVEAGDIEQAARVVHSAFNLDRVNA